MNQLAAPQPSVAPSTTVSTTILGQRPAVQLPIGDATVGSDPSAPLILLGLSLG